MAMYRRIDVTMIGGVYVVRFLGRSIARSQEVSDFGRDVSQLLHEDVARLLMDFSNIRHFSSAATYHLLVADQHVRERSEMLRVCYVQAGTLALFRRIGLVSDDRDTVFDYVATLEQALEKPWLGLAAVA